MSLRRIDGPGKFESGLVVDEYLYDLTLNGCTETEAGDVETAGWYALLRGPFEADSETLTDDEIAYLASLAGAIVATDSNGFVSVEHYSDPAALDSAWDSVERWVNDFEYED